MSYLGVQVDPNVGELFRITMVEEKTCLGSGEIENPGENYKRLEKTS